MINFNEPRYEQARALAEEVVQINHSQHVEKTAAMDVLLDFLNQNWPHLDHNNPQHVVDFDLTMQGKSKAIYEGQIEVQEAVWPTSLIRVFMDRGLLAGVHPGKMKSFREWQVQVKPFIHPPAPTLPKKYLKKSMEKQ